MKIGNLNIQENVSLKERHSFGVEVNSQYFIELNSIELIEEFVKHISEITQPIYFIGSGSNTLFTKDFKGTIVHINNKGIEFLVENDDEVLIQVGAGEIWDDFVNFCVENEYYGIENLSAIPGQIGTTPIQNIGAYGVEAKDCIEEVIYIDIEDKDTYVIDNTECQFGYRDSIFKNELKDKVIVTDVVFRLSKKADFKLDYGIIQQELDKRGIDNPNISEISNTIRRIRDSKLPDPKNIGNAGSFFKNPIITKAKYLELKKKFPKIISYKTKDDKIKIASGWMIDYLGWKGKEHHGAAVHTEQALVLTNKNNASGKAIQELAAMIQEDIMKHFDIELEAEVNIL